MQLLRSSLVASVSLIVMSSVAFAQSATPQPGSGPGAPVTGPADNLDLPDGPGVAPVEMGEEQWPPVIEEEEEEGTDPRDTRPPVIYGEEIDTETDTIVYVVDISCSMGWDSQSYTTIDGNTAVGPRIDRAKAELARSIMGLSENFRFNVYAYDCGTRQWQQDMQPADDGNKASAIGWEMALQPTGATGTGPAVALSLGDKENQAVVLLTDGAPNCGASGHSGHRVMIASANSQGATVNVFGIAASGSYRAFCQGVASDSGGSYFDVP